MPVLQYNEIVGRSDQSFQPFRNTRRFKSAIW